MTPDDLVSTHSSALQSSLESGWKRAALRDRILVVVAPLAVLLIGLVLWEQAVALLDIPLYLLPPPSTVASELSSRLELYVPHFGVTLREVVIGYAMAIAAGCALAIPIALSPLAAKMIYPFLVTLQSTPKSALAPLFIVWFGFGLTPKIAVVFLIAFFPIVVNTVVGLTSIEEEKLNLARVSGFTSRGTFRHIRVPHALPAVFAGLKVGILLALTGAVVAEFVGADSGLGYLIVVAGSTLNTPRLFAALLLLVFMGISLFVLVDFVEGRAIPWHVSRRRRSR